jgi:hypothetical protein
MGGIRNWDYRFTWIRDSSFVLYAFLKLGFKEEAAAFMKFVSKRCEESSKGDGSLQIMYGIHGEHQLIEQDLLHLEGFCGSKPVRIGNGAFDQIQLDIYGELLDTVYLSNKYAEPISYDFWLHVRKMVDWICLHWMETDEGIWEVRGGQQHFVYSKVMSWVALDRGIRLAERRSFPADLPRWHKIRDEIYEEIQMKGYNKTRKAFTQYYGSDTLDASVLIMPLVFFCFPEEDHRILTDGGFLFLDEIQAKLAEGKEILYAAYDVNSKKLVYSPGKLKVFDAKVDQRILSFTQANEARNWGANPYARSKTDADDASNHLSIRVTPEHNMFVQLGSQVQRHKENKNQWGTTTVENKEAVKPYELISASKLVSDDDRSHIRMLACAEEGVDLPESDDLEFVSVLDLTTGDQIDAFIELYGFWLGAGSISYAENGYDHMATCAYNAVRFAQIKLADTAYIKNCLSRVGLKAEVDYIMLEKKADQAVMILIHEKRWFDYFDQNYGSKYKRSTLPCSKQETSSKKTIKAGAVSSLNYNSEAMTASETEDTSAKDDSGMQTYEGVNLFDITSAKRFLSWVFKNLGKRRLRLLLEALRRGQGAWAGTSDIGQDVGYTGRFVLFTSSIRFREELLQVLLHAGYSAFFDCYREKGAVIAIKGLASKASVEGWRVCYCEPTNESDKEMCWPSMASKDIKEERNYAGKTWCVEVEHKDHLIYAQRAHREKGFVTKASRPIVIGNCSPTDPRFVSTLDSILGSVTDDGLVSNNLVFRYNVEHTKDGMVGEEGTFSICTFWAVEAAARLGMFKREYLEKSRTMFEQMLGRRNNTFRDSSPRLCSRSLSIPLSKINIDLCMLC